MSPVLRHLAAGRRKLCAAGFAAIVLTSVGCFTQQHAEMHGEPKVTSIPTMLNSADLKLPLDAYRFSLAQLRPLGQAHRVLVRQCMLRFGLDYRAPEPPPQGGPRTWNERRYGVTDAATAARQGYELVDRSANRPRSGASRRRTRDTRELSVLIGRTDRSINGMKVPAGGCVGDANRRLAGTGPADRDLAQRLALNSYYRSQQDSRVQAAIRRWSGCMKAKGFDYAGPLDPPGDPRFQDGLPPREIETATADVACKKRTNMVGVWFTVESAYQGRQIERNREALTQIKQANAAQLRRAAALAAATRAPAPPGAPRRRPTGGRSGSSSRHARPARPRGRAGHPAQ